MANSHTRSNTRAIVRIQAYVSSFSFQRPHIGQPQGEASGTGFIIEKAIDTTTGTETLLIMTAAHVVNSARRFTVRFPTLGAKEIETEKLVLIPAYDIAVFQIKLNKRRDPSLAGLKTSVLRLVTDKELNSLPQGSAVQAYGFPKGLSNVKVTTGSFNGLERNELQHDAATSPGSSGGPVVSVHLNAVIGVVSWKMVGHAVEGMHFTMPVALWRLALQRMKERPDALTRTSSGVNIMKAPMFGFCVQRVTDDLTLAQSCVRKRNAVELEAARNLMAKKAAIAVEKFLSPFSNASPKVWQDLYKALQKVQARKKTISDARWGPSSSSPPSTKKSRSKMKSEAAAKAIEKGLVDRMRRHWEQKLRAQKKPSHKATSKRSASAKRLIQDSRHAPTIWGGSGKTCSGARISDVIMGSAAWKAGMRAGDILGAIDHMPVNGRGEIMGAPWAHGQMVSVSEFIFRAIEPKSYLFTVWRGDARVELKMTAEPAHNSLCPLYPPFEIPSFIVLDGLVLMTSNANLVASGISFNLYQMSRDDLYRRTYVVVVNVIRGSRAASMGSLKQGDLIHAVGQHVVNSVEDIVKALKRPLEQSARTKRDMVVTVHGGSAQKKILFSTTTLGILRAASDMRKHMQTPSNVFEMPTFVS